MSFEQNRMTDKAKPGAASAAPGYKRNPSVAGTGPAYTDVEIVARAEYEHDMREAGCPDTWEETFRFVRYAYRDRARAGLVALAAAGLPPAKETDHAR